MSKKELWTVEELGREVGVSRSAIRYYTQRGLLPAPEFRAANTRYTAMHRDRLLEIRRLHDDLGLTLAGVAQALEGKVDFIYMDPPYEKSPAPVATKWERWAIAPGLELHVSSDAPADSRKLAAQLRSNATAPTGRALRAERGGRQRARTRPRVLSSRSAPWVSP